MTNTLEEIKKLRDTLELYSEAYYVNDEPLVTDYEYDMLMNRLKQLEKENPDLITNDSPTQKVNGYASSKFEPVEHLVPLESLVDVFTFEDLYSFGEKMKESIETHHTYSVEPKVDGLSMSLEYENGIFVRGSTRGDGKRGEDVTNNLRVIKSIPKFIPNAPKLLIVRGEVYMPVTVFNELNEERIKNNEEPFANPRNAAAGSIRQLDPGITASRHLEFVAFNLQLTTGEQVKTHIDSLLELYSYGFHVIPHWKAKSIDSAISIIDEIGKNRYGFPFQIDGAVVKIDSLAQREELGSTSRAPRWAVAYKYPPEEKETKVVRIDIQVGRSGVLTPKVIVEPINLGGTTISAATLHNQDFIDRLDIRVGDTIVMRKAGEIIPEVVRVEKQKRPEGTVPYKIPDICPECGSPVVKDNDGSAMRCIGIQCPAQKVRNLIHYASKDCMDINGLGPAMCDELINSGLVNTVADLYLLTPAKLARINPNWRRTSTKIIEEIQNSREAGLARVIFALGIPEVGKKAAYTLAEEFGSIDELMSTSVETLVDIPEIGPITAMSIYKWINDSKCKELIDRLRIMGVKMIVDKHPIIDGRFEGMIFAFTGSLENFTRTEAMNRVMIFGGKVSNGINKSVTYLVYGNNPGGNFQKAIQYGVPTISEGDFIEMIN